jgi:hypothetical protein
LVDSRTSPLRVLFFPVFQDQGKKGKEKNEKREKTGKREKIREIIFVLIFVC